MSERDSVCFDVPNAQSVFYTYTTTATVDTSKEKLPDLTSLAAALNPLMPTGQRSPPDDFRRSVVDKVPDWVGDFYRFFDRLSVDVERAQRAVKATDDPGRTMKDAKNAVDSLSRSPSSSVTDTDLKKWADAALSAITIPRDMLVYAALKAYGQTLLATRDALRASYGLNVPEVVTACAAVGKGRTTVVLRAKKNVDFGRRVVDTLALVTVTPRYNRARVEAFPLFVVGFTKNVSSFSLQQGVVQLGPPSDHHVFRLGAVLTINLPGSGDIAYGPGFGVGVSDDKKITLSELFGAFVISYKDLVRIGVGLGSTQVPTGLQSPAVIGQPLPNGLALNNLIVKSDKSAWFLMVAFPGLAFKSPF